MSQTVLTPTVGRTVRRSLFWVGVALFVLVVAGITFAAAGSSAEGRKLDATNAAPEGSKAVAEVLRQQGVTVTATSSLGETRTAITAPDDTTLLVYDNGDLLDEQQLIAVSGLARTVVLVDPAFTALSTLTPEVAQAGIVDEKLKADCDLTAVTKAGTVSGEGVGYRVTGNPDRVTRCLGSGDGVYSLVQLEYSATELTVLGTTSALTNEHVTADGNAALALNLLGQRDNLVWYLPGADDLPAGEADLGSLTPPWVTSVLVLLALTAVVAAVWRGRRFGPLVIENLPVTVRASETMLGRARLYERSSARLRALDSLRIGAVQRLATLCGLPRTASVDEVIADVAAATARQPGHVRLLLVHAQPATDADLIRLSDELLVLERDVARAVRP